MKKPVKIITLDTETYNGLLGKLKRIAIYDGEKVHYGYSFPDVENILVNYKMMGFQVHVYIHNAEFDLRKIPELFDGSRVYWKKSLIINGRIATLACHNYTIHDSFKILPMSLHDLSKNFNVEHGKLVLWEEVEKTYPGEYKDIVDFLDRCPVDDELFLTYLGYDVLSLYEVLEKVMNVSGLSPGEFVKCPSTASLSRYIFKHGYKGTKFESDTGRSDYEMLCLYNWRDNLEVEEFLRLAYCGGRTEVFTPRLNSPGFHYDVNSEYPFVMSNGNALYPVGKPRFMDEPGMVKETYENWKEDRNGLGFINCRVFIPNQFIPPLPVKMGKLVFPCGEVYGVWTYEELEFAEKECGVKILEYYACCHFDLTYPVFKNFIETMYFLKEEGTKTGNMALRTLAKLIYNTGYGYTGMRRDDKSSLDSIENVDKYDTITFADDDLGFIEVPTEITAEYIQVQVASYVTSRARLVLLKAMKDIEKRGGTVFYCDTDSIVTDIELSPELVDSAKLGYWDCESKPEKGLFLKPKVYTELFEEKKPTIKFKGISKETQSELDFAYYEELYQELETQEKEFVIVEKNKLLMRSIMYMKKKHLDSDYYETRDKKMNLNTVEKRAMLYAENKTEPLFFHNIEEFENFTFKPTKEVVFDMTKGGRP